MIVPPSNWLSMTDIGPMVDLVAKAPKRKLRLYLCAIARFFWNRLVAASRDAVIAAEAYAYGKISCSKLAEAHRIAGNASSPFGCAYIASDLDEELYMRLQLLMMNSNCLLTDSVCANNHGCDVMKDIFDDPFQPIKLAPEYISADIRRMASTILSAKTRVCLYCSGEGCSAQSFAKGGCDAGEGLQYITDGVLDRLQLSVLVDALDESGAPMAIVDHLRSKQKHFKGCWAVELAAGFKPKVEKHA